jgi:TrmH RNA methyltransferase
MKRLRPHSAPQRAARDDALKVSGQRAVEALFAARGGAIRRLFFTREMAAAAKPICAALARLRRPFRQVEEAKLQRVAGTMHPGGIVAIADPIAIRAPGEREIAAWATARMPLLVLDGVSNPHNFGAIVRTAAFLGIVHVVLSERAEQALPSDAAVRVAEGGLEHVALWRPPALGAFLRALKPHYRALAASPRGTPLARLQTDARPNALVLGNEEHGLSPAVARECTSVAIAGSGRVESLKRLGRRRDPDARAAGRARVG